MKQVPAPALKVTMQLVDPTLTVTISPLGTVSPLPVFTLTENTADDSAPTSRYWRHGDLGRRRVLLHQEVVARERSRHRGRVDKIGTGG